MKIKTNFLYKYIILCVVIIMMVTIFTTLFYNNSKKILNQSVEAQLTSNLRGVSLYIDVDAHRILREKFKDQGRAQYDKLTNGSMSDNEKQMYGFDSAEYIEMRDHMVEYADEIGAEFIYTVNFTDDYFYFVIDTDEENPSYIGEGYEGLAKKEMDFFKDSFSNDDEIGFHLISDSYGDYITGCVTLYDSEGRAETLLCVDLTTAFLKAHRRSFVTTIIIFNAALIATFIVIGYALARILKRNADMQEKIETMAYYDSLTSLPNRVSLIEKLEQMTKAVDDSNSSHSLALCFIDLDNFKKVNDHEGHVCGDILLQHIAQFLKEHSNLRPLLKSKSKDFVARLGGDEFVIVYPVENRENLTKHIEKIFEDFAKIKEEDEIMTKYNISLSLGVSLYPENADCISNLLKTADTAMYVAKNAGKGKYAIYDETMESSRKY